MVAPSGSTVECVQTIKKRECVLNSRRLRSLFLTNVLLHLVIAREEKHTLQGDNLVVQHHPGE